MGYPVEQQKYQSLANLHLFLRTRILSRIISAGSILKAAFRESVTESNGITYQRTVFASVPDQVIVVRITANKPGSVSLLPIFAA